eukprot:2714720-Amphidinium_carterae.1
MRARVRSHAAQLLVTGDKRLCGLSLPELLFAHGIDVTDFMARLASKPKKKQAARWGNTIDVLIAADLFNTRLCVYDLLQRKYICDACVPGPKVPIGYLDHHFVAGYVKKKRVQSKPLDRQCAVLTCLGLVTALSSLLMGAALLSNAWMQHGIHIQCGFLYGLAGSGYCTTSCPSYGSPYSTASVVSGGAMRARAAQGIAGTDARLADHRHLRPFRLQGESEAGDHSLHQFCNSHDLATMTARHFEAHPHLAEWHCQPIYDDPVRPLSGATSVIGPCLSERGESSCSSSCSADTPPRVSRIDWVRSKLLNIAVPAVAHDCCRSGEATPIFLAWGNPRALQGLEANTSLSQLEDLSAVCQKSLVPPFGLPFIEAVIDDDAGTGLVGLDEAREEAARTRRICLLHTRLLRSCIGVGPANETPMVGTAVDNDGDVVAELLNPVELSQLISLHCTDLREPRCIYPRRDVTAECEESLRWRVDNDIDFLRFVCIATMPKLLSWRRVNRSPLALDDLQPDPAQSLTSSQPSLHAWSNLGQLQRIEREFVTNWIVERQRRHQLRALQVQQGMQVDVASASAATERDVAIRALQVHLRAHAVPVAPYHIRLLDDLLGDDLLADDIEVVHGGMAGRRQYPFAGTASAMHGASAVGMAEVNLTSTTNKVVLVFHGTFAPFHLGHLSCIWDAKQLLSRHGFEVIKTVIGCTNEHQMRRKLSPSPVVEQLASPSLRSQVARALLDDHQVEDVQVEMVAFKTGDLLSLQVAHIPDAIHVHLVGSDVQLKPSPRTIVVLRAKKVVTESESFDKFTMFGVCRQTSALGMSSTSVRAHLEAGCIPVDYKASTLELLRSIFPQALFRSPSRGRESEITADQDRAQGIPVIPRSAASSGPVQKAMPVRRPPHVVTPSAGSTDAAPVVVVGAPPAGAHKPPLPRKRAQLASRDGRTTHNDAPVAKAGDKPPLKRMRVHLVSHYQQDVTTSGVVPGSQPCDRAPLPRAQQKPLTLSDPLPVGGLPVNERMSDAVALRAELMGHLQMPGAIKMAPPVRAHLGTFFRCVVLPICALLRIMPYLLVRRNLDPMLRVMYSPMTCVSKPLSLIMEVDQFMELNQALGHLRFIGYHYVALTINDLFVADKDHDTCRGMAVRDLFLSIGELVSQQLMVGDIIFTVTMLDAHHLVCVARARASVSLSVLAGQVITILNSIFKSARSNEHLRQQTISFSVDLSKCIFADGGMLSPHSCSSARELAHGQSVGARPFPVLHYSRAEAGDPIADCLQWVIRQGPADTVPKGPVMNANLRAIVRLWMVMAVEQRILVAGRLLVDIADNWETSVRDCIETLCSPEVPELFVTVFVYAASCALDVQLAVINDSGTCLDGFLRTRGFGLLRVPSGWCVVAPFQDSECILNELSPTLAFSSSQRLPVDSGSDDYDDSDAPVLQLASGGGAGSHKRKRELSELRSRPIHWPLWQYEGEEEVRRLHVTISNSAPHSIAVPVSWAQEEVERAFACHIAVCVDWLDFTWVHDDVSVDYTHDHPSIASDAGQELVTCFQRMPWSASGRRAASQGHEVIIGHRASRLRGLSSYTSRHENEVRTLVTAVNALLPTAVYNAAALVHHTSTPIHRDSMNHPGYDMYLLPQSVTDEAWLWFEASTGATTMELNGELVSGSWIPFNRIVCFAASLAHQVHSERKCSCLVLYRTARTPRVHHIQQLAALNFPLSMQEWNILAEEEEHPSSAADESAEECESQATTEHGEQPTTDPAPLHAATLPLGAGDVASASGAEAAGPSTEVIQLLKRKSDGTMRTIMLQVSVGSTVDQGIAVLKRFLQYSANRIMLSRYAEGCQQEPLPTPYLVLIKPSKEHYAHHVIGKSVRAVDTTVSSRPAIGARKAPRTASQPSAGLTSAGAPKAGVTEPSRVNDPATTQAVIRVPSSSMRSTPSSGPAFEQWVTEKLLKLEQQQTEALTILRQFVQSGSAASSASRTPATPAVREVIGQRRFVQGGMKRARESSRDVRMSAAHSLYVAALEVSQLEVSDEHICELRTTLCAHLQILHATDKRIAGHGPHRRAQEKIQKSL